MHGKMFASLSMCRRLFVKAMVPTIASGMRFGGIVAVGRGSHVVGMFYGDLRGLLV